MSNDELIPARVATHPIAQQNPMAILQMAVERGLDVANIRELSALAERWQDRQASQDFADALTAFKGQCPTIRKTRTAKIASRAGGEYSYDYAPLEAIAAIVDPILHGLGLSYSWDSTMEGNTMRVTCTLRHVGGHRETSTFLCPTASSSGMSDAQKYASAMTFARRQSLTAILGLTTADMDRDGGDPTKITQEQAAQIEDLISASATDRAKFLTWAGVADVADIMAKDFDRLARALKAKMGRKP